MKRLREKREWGKERGKTEEKGETKEKRRRIKRRERRRRRTGKPWMDGEKHLAVIQMPDGHV